MQMMAVVATWHTSDTRVALDVAMERFICDGLSVVAGTIDADDGSSSNMPCQ